jgi:excisionase family DNA binding protein
MVRGDDNASATLEPLLSIAEARGLLGISEAGIYRLIGRGDLALVEVGGRRLIEPAELRRFVAARLVRRRTRWSQ